MYQFTLILYCVEVCYDVDTFNLTARAQTIIEKSMARGKVIAGILRGRDI